MLFLVSPVRSPHYVHLPFPPLGVLHLVVLETASSSFSHHLKPYCRCIIAFPFASDVGLHDYRLRKDLERLYHYSRRTHSTLLALFHRILYPPYQGLLSSFALRVSTVRRRKILRHVVLHILSLVQNDSMLGFRSQEWFSLAFVTRFV